MVWTLSSVKNAEALAEVDIPQDIDGEVACHGIISVEVDHVSWDRFCMPSIVQLVK